MASGVNPILNLQGKVTADHALMIVIVANGDVTAPRSPIAHLLGSVDANGCLRVRVK